MEIAPPILSSGVVREGIADTSLVTIVFIVRLEANVSEVLRFSGSDCSKSDGEGDRVGE